MKIVNEKRKFLTIFFAKKSPIVKRYFALGLYSLVKMLTVWYN